MKPHSLDDIPKVLRKIKRYYTVCERRDEYITINGLAAYLDCTRATLVYHNRRGGPIADALSPLFPQHRGATRKKPKENRGGKHIFEGDKCEVCEGTRRYMSTGHCVRCLLRKGNTKPKLQPPTTKDPNEAFAKASFEDVALWTPYFSPVNILTS